MPFNVNEFKAKGLFFGGARPSLFQATLSVPPDLAIDNLSVQKFSFTARAAEIPASEIASFDVPYFGRKIKMAGDRTFADWRVTIMNDEDFAVRSVFEAWQNAINKLVANSRSPAVNGELYKTDINIVQFAKDATPLREYTLVGAFPTTVDAIALDWNSTNNIEEFSVTFAYDYWIPTLQGTTPTLINPGIDENLNLAF